MTATPPVAVAAEDARGETISYHKNDEGDAAWEAYAKIVASISREDLPKLVNLVAHGAKATMGAGGVVLTRRDWDAMKFIPLATPHPAPAVAEKPSLQRPFDRASFSVAKFAAALKRAADARGVTMKEISAATGVSETTLSRMNSGERSPDAASLAALSAWAGLNPANFCFPAEPAVAAEAGQVEKWCLACDKGGHQTHECHSTHGLNTPADRELSRLCEAAHAALTTQPAQPLSEERVTEIYRIWWDAPRTSYADLVRAVEAACAKAWGIGIQPAGNGKAG